MEVNRIFYAYLDEFNKITILLPKNYFKGKSSSFTLIKGTEETDVIIEQIIDIGNYMKYITVVPTFIELGCVYDIKDEYGNTTDLLSGSVVRSPRFDTQYYYDKDDLGYRYTREQTTFKVWTPVATKVDLYIKTADGEQIVEMERKQYGIFEVTVIENCEGYFYQYIVNTNNTENRIIDPYGIASNANHEFSVVVDPGQLTKVTPMQNKIENPVDAIIYEISIRDFTIDTYGNIQFKGKYLGLTQENTKTPTGFKTGLDYLVDLGVTHVQIMPFYDFFGIDEEDPERNYNWGYNPEQYNVPEGSYSLNPNNPYSRINELRQLINKLHEKNIGVIMDVVYNHVYDVQSFPFERLVSGYYYRYDEHGHMSNGSGCGNDLATERLMVRKFIVDSITYWAREYKIDGFRFDLMGLIDIDTMNYVRKELDEIDRDIIVYGEGWNIPTPIPDEMRAAKENAQHLPRIGFFNDRYRDVIKGQTFDLRHHGFALGNIDLLEDAKMVIAGSVGYNQSNDYMFYEPYQSINYVECHDNHTMYDKFKVALDYEIKQVRLKRHQLATAITLLSQGVPFLHSGQEFFRKKYGVENSYNSPDKINLVSWRRAEKYKQEIELVKELIKLRKDIKAFRLDSASKIRKHVSFSHFEDGVLVYELNDVKQYSSYTTIKVIINITNQEYVDKVDTSYKLIFDDKYYPKGRTIPNYLIIPPLKLIIIGQ